MKKDKNAYLKFFITWTVVAMVGIGLFFWSGTPYYRGVAIGLMMLSASLFTIDGFLQQRSADYHKNITTLL